MASRNVCNPRLPRLAYQTTLRMFGSGGSGNPPQIHTPGLSENVVSVPGVEVGPGASKKSDYKNPEYFCYSNVSYFEAEVEMSKYRLKQPSNKTHLKNDY